MRIIFKLFFIAIIMVSIGAKADTISGFNTATGEVITGLPQGISQSQINAAKQLTPSQQEAIKQQIQAGGGITPSIIKRAKSEIKANKSGNIENKTAISQNAAGKSAEQKTNINISSVYQRDLHIKSGALKVNENLKPFGYKLFQRRFIKPLPAQPVSNNYVIGPGDVIKVLLWGLVNAQYTMKVGQDGTILFPRIGPLSVAGMKYGRMKSFLTSQAKRITGTNVAITLGRLRQIQVFVLGEVKEPGPVNLTAMSTILDALMASGGPAGDGSVRDIELKRKGEIVSRLDLYNLLMKGDKANDLILHNGDIVFVPMAGSLVGVAGHVRRPAIYELKNKKTLAAAIKLAGGMLPSAWGKKIQVQRILNHNLQIVLDIEAKNKAKFDNFALKDGDLIKIFSVVPRVENSIKLEGNVLRPGSYEWKPKMRISDIIHSTGDLLPNTLMNYAMIKRLITTDNHYEYRSFSLRGLLINHQESDNLLLEPHDTIMVFNKWNVMPRKRVHISGAVNKPGKYIYLPNMRVSTLIKLAGGLKRYADLKDAELTRRIPKQNGMAISILDINLKKALRGLSSNNILLKNGDYLMVKNVSEWKKIAYVKIGGEVMFPGKYAIKNGEHLSSLISRAGGFTKEAYLPGALFTRQSVKKQQKKQIDRLVNKLQTELLTVSEANAASAATVGEAKIASIAVEQRRKFLQSLRKTKPTGRIVIRVSLPNRLKDTSSDIVLKGGDKLFIPKNPDTISVVGAVFNQETLLYSNNQKYKYYIDHTGGYTKQADKDSVFIIKADGEAVRASKSSHSFQWNKKLHRWENSSTAALSPGDTIVVPYRLAKSPWLRTTKDVAQILFDLAGTAKILTLF